jgi:YVTN family beta-propeller protein
MEAYVTGVSKGTTPTTFSPNETVTRVQMTTFLQRSLDQGLTRANRRAALNRWRTSKNTPALQTVGVGSGQFPQQCDADGENIWVSAGNGNVTEVQASTGKVSGTWTGAIGGTGILAALGKVFVAGVSSGDEVGILYVLDPTKPPGSAFASVNELGFDPFGIAFDGNYLWTANFGDAGSGLPGSVTVIQPFPPYVDITLTMGFASPTGVLYDGVNIWVTDAGAGTLLKLDTTTLAILQMVNVGALPQSPVFDGANIWVPNQGDSSITVVQASTGSVVATIAQDASNQLNGLTGASFDGERILVTNQLGNSVTVFKAADLSLIANVSTGSQPVGACNDGINFWVPLSATSNLLRL